MSTPISIHQRTYATEAFDEGGDVMRVHGRLVDTKPFGLTLSDGGLLVIHDMVLDLFVDSNSFEIVGVEADMDVHPYQLYTAVLASDQQLVGVSIARGYSRKVRELFGGPNGYSHLGSLLLAMGPVAVQASWSLGNLHRDPIELVENTTDPIERERQLSMNVNTCHVWREDGENITNIRQGNRPSLPNWEVGRLRELGVEV